MALTNEDLKAISDLMDEKIDPINGRLDKVDGRLDKVDVRLDRMDVRFDKMDGRLKVLDAKQDMIKKQLDDLELDMKVAARDIRKDIHNLNDEMGAVIEVLRINELMPR